MARLTLAELTSGLDSFTALKIVEAVKGLARRGKTVIAIVHQPSTDIFEAFDRIYLLAAGREVYQVRRSPRQ
jgi:ABC-type multidrug transport system ATPase subunit